MLHLHFPEKVAWRIYCVLPLDVRAGQRVWSWAVAESDISERVRRRLLARDSEFFNDIN